jgi:hypothetical protein
MWGPQGGLLDQHVGGRRGLLDQQGRGDGEQSMLVE